MSGRRFQWRESYEQTRDGTSYRVVIEVPDENSEGGFRSVFTTPYYRSIREAGEAAYHYILTHPTIGRRG